jgi:hypothetical protein
MTIISLGVDKSPASGSLRVEGGNGARRRTARGPGPGPAFYNEGTSGGVVETRAAPGSLPCDPRGHTDPTAGLPSTGGAWSSGRRGSTLRSCRLGEALHEARPKPSLSAPATESELIVGGIAASRGFTGEVPEP